MPWARVDDSLFTNAKVIQLQPASRWLYIAGICYSNQNLTDGFITEAAALSIGMIPRPRKAVEELVSVGLWERESAGYRVHDYLEYNLSRERILADREASRRRQERHRDGSGRYGRNGSGHAVTDGVTDGVSHGEVTTPPLPLPLPSTDLHPQTTTNGGNPGSEGEDETKRTSGRAVEALALDACAVLGDQDHAAALERGNVKNRPAHRKACRAGAVSEHLEAARALARDHPDWPAERIAHDLTPTPDTSETARLYEAADELRRTREADAPAAPDWERNRDRVAALKAAARQPKEDPDHAE